MAVQRKIFRIEEHARSRAPQGVAEDAARPHDLMAELRALRELVEPRAPAGRDEMDRARAQIAEAQAYKSELAQIHAAVERSRLDMAALGSEVKDGEQTARASREMAAIVTGTERSTQSILQAAEEIDQAANTLSAVLKNGHDQGMAHDIRDRVVQIFEACNFQDLTGQRVANVVATLRSIEDRVARLLEIWQAVEQFKPAVDGDHRDGDSRFLNGPKLSGDRGHSTQNDIDTMFG